ncbi:MAG TPA: alpha-L-arabinofuranosidase, partial [Blastocatellia bacterium]
SHYGWTPVLLSTLVSMGVTPDFAIYHRYEQAPGQENDATLLQAAATWKDDAANLRMMLNDYLGQAGASVELVCTENNSVYTNPGKQSTSIVNGLYLADSTGELMQTEFNSLVWWDLHNGRLFNDNNSPSLYGWRQYGDYGIMAPNNKSPYPTYYVKTLLSHFASGGDQVVTASSDNTLLAAYSVLGADGTLRLMVINKSPKATTTANIQLTGFNATGTATLFSYGIPQDNAAKNHKGSPDVAETSVSNVSSNFSYKFKPYSVSVLVLSQSGGTDSVRAALH